MTVGKDMTLLFMDMLKCMMSTDVELKKLVYLYRAQSTASSPAQPTPPYSDKHYS